MPYQIIFIICIESIKKQYIFINKYHELFEK